MPLRKRSNNSSLFIIFQPVTKETFIYKINHTIFQEKCHGKFKGFQLDLTIV